MAIGKESEGQVFAYPDYPPQKTVFARTRLLTVESGGTAPTTLEIVQIPTRVLPAERGWPDRYLMRQAERYTMLRLALYSRPAPPSSASPNPHRYRWSSQPMPATRCRPPWPTPRCRLSC
jgi:hypothetical protein